MRVLFPIGALYPSQTGGPANSIYWLGKALHKNGIEVTIITTDNGIAKNKIELNKWLDLDYGKVIYCAEFNYTLNIKLIIKSIQNIKKTDIVHLTSIFDILSIIIFFYALFLDKKIVWSVRGEFAPKALKIKSRLKKCLLFFIKRTKKKVYFHSTVKQETEYIKEQMGYSQKVIEIPNYMEIAQFKGVLKKTNDYFLYLGRLHPIKAIENLLEGYAMINEINIPKLKIVGSGDEKYVKSLKIKCENLNILDKVSFMGHVSGQEKYNILKNAKFLILPSYTENFGNVVIEALSQGTPVIASRGTPWEILDISKSGFWVPNSPKSLSKIIKACSLLDKNQYQEMRDNAFNLAKQNYDINTNINTWITAYNKIINL